MFSSLFGLIKKQKACKNSSREKAKAKSKFGKHLRIENLESRQLLSVTAWTGAGQTYLWSNPANWTNGAPGNGSDIVFSGSGGAYSVNNIDSVTFRSITFSSNSNAILSYNNIPTAVSYGIFLNSGVSGTSISTEVDFGGGSTLSVGAGSTLQIIVSYVETAAKFGSGATVNLAADSNNWTTLSISGKVEFSGSSAINLDYSPNIDRKTTMDIVGEVALGGMSTMTVGATRSSQ